MRRLVVVVLVAILFVTAGCSQKAAVRQIRLDDLDSQVVTKNQTHEQLPLRVAVSSILSPRETLTVYQPLLDYLEKQVGIPVVLLQRKTYKEVNDLLRDGVADVAFVCSGGYVAGRQTIPLELLAVPIVNGQIVYQSYIITHPQIEAGSIADLRGRSFAFTDPMSFSGRIAPVDMLESKGLDSAHFFGRTFFTYSHDNAIKAVVDGIADAAAVDSMILDQALQKDPSIRERLKIVEKSIQVGNPPVVVNSTVEGKRKEILRTALLTMHESEQGKGALIALRYDKFSIGDEATYSILQTMWIQVKEKL